uniref:Uncharacterized protein n=1 Tax=Anguilla anguilla TaxID=7936 RepID=A0A0E9W831_ANGAN
MKWSRTNCIMNAVHLEPATFDLHLFQAHSLYNRAIIWGCAVCSTASPGFVPFPMFLFRFPMNHFPRITSPFSLPFHFLLAIATLI